MARRVDNTMLVSVAGDLDASNSCQFARYVERQLIDCEHLTVDLSATEFIGTAGYSALCNVDMTCARMGVPWSVVAGANALRVLRICDPQGVLPVAYLPEPAAATV